MPRPSLPWVVGLVMLASSPSAAQQVVEIDFEAGRTIVDDEWRAMNPSHLAVDWSRGVFYVTDSEEPYGVMAFSLETGKHLRTIATPKGEGPGELMARPRGLAIAPHGGLYVIGYPRVVEFGLEGEPLATWLLASPPTKMVCNFGDEPAIATQGGVVRRKPDGTAEIIGPVRSEGNFVAADEPDIALMSTLQVFQSNIACTDSIAYVLVSYDMGPDTVFVYDRNGGNRTVLLPTEGIEGMMDCRPWGYVGEPPKEHCRVALHDLRPSFDDRRNLVLFGLDNQVHGVIIDPETGCHALVNATTDKLHRPVAVHADSALVFHYTYTEQVVNGRPTMARVLNRADKVSLHPLRRVSGDPCPGMLTTVN